MPKPYFKGQTACVCGCFYPDVTRIRDDALAHERVFFCVVHGEVRVKLSLLATPRSSESGMPTEGWRAKERERLKALSLFSH